MTNIVMLLLPKINIMRPWFLLFHAFFIPGNTVIHLSFVILPHPKDKSNICSALPGWIRAVGLER